MKHELNGVEITPRNIQEIGFKSNWSKNIAVSDRDMREMALNVDTLILPREGKDVVLDWINTNGVFEKLPYKITLDDGHIINYYIDLCETAKFKTDELIVKIKVDKGFDNFYELAQGTSFDLLKVSGVDFESFNIPYIVIPDNQIEVGITLSISTYIMGKTVIEEIRNTATLISDTIAAITPLIGTGWVSNIGAIAACIIKLALQIAYTILLIIALIKLLEQLKELIFPKVRNFLGSKVKTLIGNGCSFYGFEFQSTLLDSLDGLTILPVPLVKSKHKGFKGVFDNIANDLNFAFTKGYPSASDSTPTLWSLIDAIETQFNATTRVVNGVVRIERRDYWQNLATTNLIPSLVLQDTRQDEFEFNTFDVWKRYYIHYQPDFTDTNTLDNFDNTDLEYSNESSSFVPNLGGFFNFHQPQTISNKTTIKGIQDIDIKFSLGTRKTKLNFIEKRCKSLFDLIDFICGTSYASQITDRIGVLVVTNQFYSTTKLLYTENGKQVENFTDYLSPTFLWDNYHYINKIQLNSYKIKDSVKIPMNQELYVNLLNNNFVLIDGLKCELITLEYKPYFNYAIISYREPFDYVGNTIKTILING